jgi:hypothetical protein
MRPRELTPTHQNPAAFTFEATQRLSLDSRSVFGGENLNSAPLRVGTDGRLYQLRSDRKRGVSVARYSLSAVRTAAA